MKNLKLSFALIIAILAVGFTVATKANPFAKRQLTRCFTTLQAANLSNVQQTYNASGTTCATAQANVTSGFLYIKTASVANSIASSDECPDGINYCCAELVEVLSGQPGFAIATPLNLGDGVKRYRIAEIFCKP